MDDELENVISEMDDLLADEQEPDLDQIEKWRDKLKGFQRAIDRDEIRAKTLVMNVENITVNHVKSIEHISDVDLSSGAES